MAESGSRKPDSVRDKDPVAIFPLLQTLLAGANFPHDACDIARIVQSAMMRPLKLEPEVL
jgi:hypothetical protein